MKLSLIFEDETPANIVVPVIKALINLSVSVLLDMREGPVRQKIMSVYPILATMGLYARKKFMAVLVSVCLDPKAGIMTWKGINVFLISVRMRLYASIR